ncbi:MAG TPA: glycoside hydrolase family 5 protein [Cellvibrionaceae bacterium]|nr:glycoside hydrolase family 5 protein [Cellvibrionaceae bacterium]
MGLIHRVLGFILVCASCAAAYGQSYVVTNNGALAVKGTQIVNSKGKPIALAGPSFFWSNSGWGAEGFFNAQTVAWAKNNWQATVIRAVMGIEGPGGYLASPDANKQRVFAVIDAAIAEDMYVLVDWHDHHAERHTAEAVQFFTEVAKKYGAFPNVIYEIYNEPKEVSWVKDIKPYAQTLVNAIRVQDSDNLIAVGTPRWSQDVDEVAKAPLSGQSNIVYSLHFYAGTHHQGLRDKAAKALDKGLPLMVTEWGTVNADGNGGANTEETRRWMEFLRKHTLSHCNWAISIKNEGASIFKTDVKPADQYTDAQLTPSGLLARDWVRSWRPLSQPQ